MYSVLAVDDEPYILQLIQWILGGDYRVLTAPSGEAALAVLSQEAVDIVVADLRMPGMSGLELLRIVKDHYPGVVRVLATAYTTEEVTAIAVQEIGVYQVLSKPWEAEELCAMVKSALAHGAAPPGPAPQDGLRVDR